MNNINNMNMKMNITPGMLFGHKCGNFQLLCILSACGCAYLHLKWVYDNPFQSIVVQKKTPEQVGGKNPQMPPQSHLL